MRGGVTVIAVAILSACGGSGVTPKSSIIDSCASAHARFLELADGSPIELSEQQVESACGCAAEQTLSFVHVSAHEEYATQFESVVAELLEILEDLVETGEGDPQAIAHEISTKSPAKIAAIFGFAQAYIPCANQHGIDVPDPFDASSFESTSEDRSGEALEKLLERRD